MTNYFTEQQQLLAQMVQDFAKQEIKPHLRHWDDQEIFPIEVFKKMGELGLGELPDDKIAAILNEVKQAGIAKRDVLTTEEFTNIVIAFSK